MTPKPPDVIVLGAKWPERALLRAQLIEEGHEVWRSTPGRFRGCIVAPG